MATQKITGNLNVTGNISQSGQTLDSLLSDKADLVNGKVPEEQLPSYVDDIVEAEDFAHLPDPGEQGKIYLTLDTDLCYRWSGSQYVQVNAQDNVKVYDNFEAFPEEGDIGVIYIASDTNKQYRWGDGKYISLSEYLPLSGGTLTGNLNVGAHTIYGANEINVKIGNNQIPLAGKMFNQNAVYFGSHSEPTTILSSEARPRFDTYGDYLALVSDTAKLVETTWAALKALRDGGNLVPGMQYRITDYDCTTTEAGSNSAHHIFDIIVTADSASILNENARACLHAGDTYFANSRLQSWALLYCIDNDSNRFAWADTTNGKGVVYWMRDEFDNECWYDFKNILFNKKIGNTYKYSYTFTWADDDDSSSPVTYDASIKGNDGSLLNPSNKIPGVYGNIVGQNRNLDNKLALNFNSFVSIKSYTSGSYYGVQNNLLGDNCERNDFLGLARDNILEAGCKFNSFGGTFRENHLSVNCTNNTFNGSNEHNTLGEYCGQNTIGSSSSNNILEAHSRENSIGYYSSYNHFGVHSQSNTLGAFCNSVKMGANCSNIIIGDHSDHIVFGNSCSYITMSGQEIKDITMGNICSYVTIGGNYCRDIIVESGCKYILLSSSSLTPSYSNQLQNVKICLGVKGASSSNRLNINMNRNLSYETEYKIAGSTAVIL